MATASSATSRRFNKLGLVELSDFITHLPLRYEDETQIHSIAHIKPGQHVLIEGQVHNVQVRYQPRRQLSAQLQDTSGQVNLRWLHFYPSQVKQLESGERLRIQGEVRRGYHGLEIFHPRLSKAGAPLARALTPIYPTTNGLSQAALRKAIHHALEFADLSDTLPEEIRNQYQLMPFSKAIHFLHYPDAATPHELLLEHVHPSWQRIKFDEILAQQLSLVQARAARKKQKAPALQGGEPELLTRFYASLPFQLTHAQEKALADILHDLQQAHPMHRLLQGDVGSGKTIVAAIAALQAIESGFQVAIMAPTEILAEQHYEKLSQWFEPLHISLCWLTGRQSAAQRRPYLADIASGSARLIIGTQALIQEQVNFKQLGLVILDEQHRFGVGQRLELAQKGDQQHKDKLIMPHQLSMSATPIPRTLAMTFFADLDVSTIDELPPGRTPVLTKLINSVRRDEVIALVLNAVKQGRQAYWVCPLVEESEALQLQTAIDTHDYLAKIFSSLSVGLIHGRLNSQEKQAIMQAFRQGDIQILVATTVIEVGVDVPNASLMVIEHAERFGLAQLHQLRGRVGRGTVESVCVLLFAAPLSTVARERLRAMYESNDGFEIARRDLAIRGPGEFLGMRQSGQQLLRFASLDTDDQIVTQAREAAQQMLEQFPEYIDNHIRRWMKGRQELLRS